MSEEIQKAKCGRPRKKPDYDRTEHIDVLLEKAVDLLGEPFDDRKERSKDAPSIRDVANQVYEAAKEKYPERWNGRATRDWSLPDIVYLNPETEANRLSPVGF